MASKMANKIANGDEYMGGFDVTCVIGRVELGPDGDERPHHAAFKLIADHGSDGEYSFPTPDGGTQYVTTHYVPPTPEA